MAGADGDCRCTAEEQQQQQQEQQQQQQQQRPTVPDEAGRRPPPLPPPGAAPGLSPCDVEALKRCLIEHDGDQRRCQAEVEAFKRACGMQKGAGR